MAGCSEHGSALVLSIIFLAVFSALAVAMASVSGTNVQVAENQRKADITRTCADSGLEVVRYWMSKVTISGTTAGDDRFTEVANSLADVLTDAGATNITTTSTASAIVFSEVSLDSSRGQSFSALLSKIDNDNIQLDVTGHYGSFEKTIRTNYVFGTQANTVFDYGVASKGPVNLTGNIELDGVTIDVESNA